jgi:predicted transcriptional regulator
MLSVKQQQLLLEIFVNYMRNGVNRRDVRGIYSSYVSFYRASKYLVDSGLLVKHRDQNHKSFYSLTLRGEILARIIAGLKGQPEEYQKLAKGIKMN